MAGWMAAGLCAVAAERAPVAPFETADFASPPNEIDRAVFAALAKASIPAANPCSDAVFLRRVCLDLTGVPPTAAEAAAFLADTSPAKRAALVDRLLDRPEYADYWAMKWCDLLRVKSEFPVNLWPNAVQAYHKWIRDSVRDNKPYDRFARELLTASGSNFRDPPVNFFRATESHEPPALAKATALAFLGARIEKWPEAEQAGFSAFFAKLKYKGTSEWKEEILVFDPAATCTNPAVAKSPLFPGGVAAKVPADQDPREALADWLAGPGRDRFAQAAVNRLWFWVMGRGVVHEPDDFRADNPPSNPDLLAALTKTYVESGYDTKKLLRLIVTSRTYQLSPLPASDHPDGARLFAYNPLRRLDAEVLIDAICRITGTTEEYSSAIPEPFTFIPKGEPAEAVADGSITSPYLALFGRSPRDTGLLTERNNNPTWAQRLHGLNSTHVRRKLENGPALQTLYTQAAKNPGRALDELYLTILSRPPTAEEREQIRTYRGKASLSDRQVAVDVAWALINTPEFLYRH